MIKFIASIADILVQQVHWSIEIRVIPLSEGVIIGRVHLIKKKGLPKHESSLAHITATANYNEYLLREKSKQNVINPWTVSPFYHTNGIVWVSLDPHKKTR